MIEGGVRIKYLIDFAALALLYVFVFLRRWKGGGRDKLFVNTLLYIYLSFVLYFTLMPVITALPFMLNHPYEPMNLVPFIDVSMGRGDFARQVILNVVMTVPFGILFPLTQNRAAKFSTTVFFCFLMSLGIELLQPFFGRSSDITDLITNAAGGALGYGLYAVFKPAALWVLARLRAGDRIF